MPVIYFKPISVAEEDPEGFFSIRPYGFLSGTYYAAKIQSVLGFTVGTPPSVMQTSNVNAQGGTMASPNYGPDFYVRCRQSYYTNLINYYTGFLLAQQWGGNDWGGSSMNNGLFNPTSNLPKIWVKLSISAPNISLTGQGWS